MRKVTIIFAAASTFLISTPAAAGPAEDASTTISTWLDKFNAGDLNAFKSGHAQNAVIVDEFAPHVWTGPNAPQQWLESYEKDATAKGISKSHMDYAAPIRAEASDRSAYIVVPTIYSCEQGGKKKSAGGNMTFVMNKIGNEWKIASWTYSAVEPK